MKLLILISLFLSLLLIWEWFDHCGEEVVLGETLPFCNDCSTFASVVRLILLVVAGVFVGLTVKRGQSPTVVYRPFSYPAHAFRIHWHRLALLIALLGFPLWISWLDFYTDIPEPNEVWLIKSACSNAEVKATFLWTIELTFVVFGFRILNKS